MLSELPADLRAAVELGGEMGRRFAEFDWSSHPLGPVDGWSAQMRATVATALASRFPTVLWLGDQLYLVYNDGYIGMLGDRHPAALGRSGREVWWDIWDVIAPMLDGVVNSGVATWSNDLMLPLVTGGRAQERYFTFTYSPFFAADGTVEGVFCPVTETTQRVLGERRLALLNSLAGATLNADSVPATLRAAVEVCAAQDVDLPFIAAYVAEPGTPEAILQASTPAVAALLGEVAPTASFWRTRLRDGGLIDDVCTRLPALLDALGDHCPEQALVLPLGDAGPGRGDSWLVAGINPRRPLDEQYRGWCGLLADQVGRALVRARAYEEERFRAEQLAELDRVKTAFFTNVSHELRTPLTLILGPAGDALADTDPPLTGEHRHRVEVLRRNAERLLQLVNTLLDFSRLQSGPPGGHFEPLDLTGYTAELASMFEPAFASAGLTLTVETEPLPEAPYVDREMWAKIVLNLVANALKFTFDGGITVRLRPAGDRVELTVTDTGVGIPPEEQAHLFERFHRAPVARSRSHEGTGIGLALVAELAQLHGGEVSVQSAPGVGSTFTVRLPLGAAHLPADQIAVPASPAAHSTAGTAAEQARGFLAEAMRWLDVEREATSTSGEPRSRPRDAAGSRSRVLVVDDNADMRDYIARLLGADYDLTVLPDGEAALASALADPPDLVLADVMMPRLDGFGLLAKLRGEPATASVPVIMLSARAGEDGIAEGLEAGADDYLTKPFSARELRARVRANIDLKRARQQVATREHEVADELQRSLLPPRNFEPEHLDVASFYRPGVEGTQVGGDWYDVIELGAGRTALVIGDVMGRGVRAAAVMGQLRSAIRAYARLDLPPADVLDFLDGVVSELGADQIVTCLYAVYDPADRVLTYANAGHLPPLLAVDGGPGRPLTAATGPPLGAGPMTLTEARVELPAGAVVALYTDGLVERRDRDLDSGIDELARRLAAVPATIEDAPQALVDALLPDGPDDDVAVLLARVPDGSSEPMSVLHEIPAREDSVPLARAFVAATLAEWSTDGAIVDDVVHCVSELVTNAIVHGRPPVELRVRCTPNQLYVETHDAAPFLPRRLRPTPEDEHGRGLQLVAVLADRWGTRPTQDGKSVWCAFRLTG